MMKADESLKGREHPEQIGFRPSVGAEQGVAALMATLLPTKGGGEYDSPCVYGHPWSL